MSTPQEKGDALENAVAAIEEFILQSAPGVGRKPIVEKKKTIAVDGVHHEIDVYVTADIAPGYKAIFIFECKNWKEAVSKNDIIIFSEKIDASGANSGCFVAKSYSADAVNQAQRDPRITLLLAAEYDEANGAEAFQFFMRSPEITTLVVTMFKRGGGGLDRKPIDANTARLECFGQYVDIKMQLDFWSVQVCTPDLLAFFEEPVPAGIYTREVKKDLAFGEGEIRLNDVDVERLNFDVKYKVRVAPVPVVSHFEIKSRGRCITFAPQLIGNDTKQLRVVIPFVNST